MQRWITILLLSGVVKGNKIRSDSVHATIASSKLKNIYRLNEAAPAIKRPAFSGRPQNDCVRALRAAPGQGFVQQFPAQSPAAHFRDHIKVSQVSMSFRFVNRIRHFLEQLHTNMTQQLLAIIDNPAAPSARVGAKGLVHP